MKKPEFQSLESLEPLVVSSDAIALPAGFKVKVVNTSKETDPAFMTQVGQLRYKVWQDQGMDMSNSSGADQLLDSVDDHAIIWGVYYEGKMVGTARLNLFATLADSPTYYMHNDIDIPCASPVATFTRLVLLNDFRGMKLGRFFDQIRWQQARQLGAKTAFLMCPPWRVAPLQRLGYRCLGKASPSKLWPDADWMIMIADLDG